MAFDEKESNELYELMHLQLKELVRAEKCWIANLANASALLWQSLEKINWAGFYFMCDGMLVLGPFQGKPACIRISVGRGVCGTAAAKGDTVLVKNVHDFPGHITCDADSNSEIVVPLFYDGRVIAVMDIDSPVISRFTEEDREGLEVFARILEQACDWEQI